MEFDDFLSVYGNRDIKILHKSEPGASAYSDDIPIYIHQKILIARLSKRFLYSIVCARALGETKDVERLTSREASLVIQEGRKITAIAEKTGG